jgi:glyoxylase-like metal-dependent hydrolase (beta-lactamase superfamily II)
MPWNRESTRVFIVIADELRRLPATMSELAVKRELGRGERVLPGLWRLRLPLPWPGVPHCNAWAIADGDGIVLVDCGIHLPGSVAQLERALEQVGLRLELVRTLVITHAHADHWGQAATVIERSGCEVWMHPNFEHARAGLDDPEAVLTRQLEIGRQSGVSEGALQRYVVHARELPSGVAAVVEPDRELLDGVTVETDLGSWRVYETPGHAPSHVCLMQAERRVLVSGDHLLGRVSPVFDYGWAPDPVGEFLSSLDVIAPLDARLCLSGHGRPFTDVTAHIQGNRELVAQRLAAHAGGLAERPLTALELVPVIFGEPASGMLGVWRLNETLAYLTHLQQLGQVVREPDGDGVAERWRLAQP